MILPEGIELKDIARVYPSAVIEHEGIETSVSLEWFEEKKNEVQLKGYELIFISKSGQRKGIFFPDFEEMMQALEKIYLLLKEST
ncbi:MULTISPECIES: hypothetical protein [unclassified Nitratiruptor]|uniref:hypothetical protein n=1 Tax=unclassified Nitratiruptor TaxID=2624044 RepID=UPI001915B851|nr:MULTISPECIES: hypothetical protein [unclassified Nitratiruptor]BCD60299.1 hypothetical protein NitYY0810_C1064 [Nitratiruptor sp. YY08-10]BCD64211.1 hypothetical protein NitYY0814_C1056 [Nitratiruptor sp. YY08-14]